MDDIQRLIEERASIANKAELIMALRRCSYMTVADELNEDYCKHCAYYTEDSVDVTCIDRMMIDAADALEVTMAEIDRKNEAIQELRSEIADIKDGIRETAVAIYEYEGSFDYADWILDTIGEADRDIDEIAEELAARTAKGEHDE